MKNFLHMCIIFLMLNFVNLLCIGMENINDQLTCDHLNNCEQSYTITDCLNEKPNQRSTLCSNCAKIELMRRLNKWAHLDKDSYFYCGLLKPVEGVKIKYCEDKEFKFRYYVVFTSDGKCLPGRKFQKGVFLEGDETYMTDFFYIDLENDRCERKNKAKVYMCDRCFCDRYGDMVSIEKDDRILRNISYASGPNYIEVRNCEDNGHVKLGYTVEINQITLRGKNEN